MDLVFSVRDEMLDTYVELNVVVFSGSEKYDSGQQTNPPLKSFVKILLKSLIRESLKFSAKSLR
eukprot:5383974-Heterocapsa_arctica.AAC.1